MSEILKGVIKENVLIKDIYLYQNMNSFIFRWMWGYFDDNQMTPPDWLPDEATAIMLDMQYCMVHSGDKRLSHTFYNLFKMTENDDDLIMQRWIFMLLVKFKDKWEKEYAALTASYKPLENYDSVEEITRSGDDKVSTNVNMDATGYDKAFNSSDLEANAKSHTEGNATNNYSKTDWNSKIKTEKHGNIGVTTSQQMLESEIELRNKYNFYDIMMNDIDSLMTTNLYK